ncbi:unnamed protein product [Didymodactylos carnosus]|uniref:Transient receptor potential cation channel subfamily A member 1 n=1 Tax=Didymodactylos carnosus TaxID=1234261 RepID=A0A815KAH9_9BILA|nr:unnamed protein product [Didymodactylos carnosus]CAF1393052.1 unnamed protein product [Didymodactylos carnosus]CAF4027025.1 unnamed protein product [Didymodactylos carnosus]CAF4287365.1 unnamed protein product [Didymodactylos carnosus]
MNVLHICVEQSGPSSSKNQNDENKNKRYLEICKALLLDYPSKKLLDDDNVKQLLQACDNEKNTPLHLAVKANNTEIFKCLLESCRNMKNTNPDEEKKKATYGITEPRNRSGRTPLLECAKHNCTSFIEEILSTKDNSRKWKTVLDHQLSDQDRMTCLHLACSQEVVIYLLDYTDADPTIRTAKGYNCLDIAIAKHYPNIVKRLLEYSEWRTLMESAQYEGSDVPITPMRRLIISMPDIAYELIDKRFTTSIGDEGQPKHLIKYDYTFIDDHYNICDWHPGELLIIQRVLNTIISALK